MCGRLLDLPCLLPVLFLRFRSSAGTTIIFSLVVFSAIGRNCRAQDYPRPYGFVNDYIGLLDRTAQIELDQRLRYFADSSGIQIAIAIISTTAGVEIQQYTNELFARWKVGQKGLDNGCLIVVAKEDRQLWIETGYGLESLLPDALVGQIYRNELRPSFQAGDYAGGLTRAVQSIESALQGKYEGSSTKRHTSKTERNLTLLFIIVALFIFFLVLSRMVGPRRRWQGESSLPWILLSGPWRGGRRTGGFWSGGSFGGGGFAGGFGGFGGGASGGGGAGGGW